MVTSEAYGDLTPHCECTACVNAQNMQQGASQRHSHDTHLVFNGTKFPVLDTPVCYPQTNFATTELQNATTIPTALPLLGPAT
jgi:hypothetical protein